ncbi:MAG: hypothetical protein ABN480_14430 [Dickeya sp.]
MTELTKEALTDAIRSAAVKAASTDERRVLSYAAGEIERQGNEIKRLKSDIRELTEAMNRARRTAKELGEENHALRNPASTEKITAQLEGLKYTRAEPNGWTCKTLAHGRVTDDVAESWNGAIDAAILTIADWDALRQAQDGPLIGPLKATERDVTAEHQRVIGLLLGVCGAALELADDACNQEVDGEPCHVVPADSFSRLSDWLDEIENTLPDQPGDLQDTVLQWAAVPRHALRSLLTAAPQSEGGEA